MNCVWHEIVITFCNNKVYFYIGIFSVLFSIVQTLCIEPVVKFINNFANAHQRWWKSWRVPLTFTWCARGWTGLIPGVKRVLNVDSFRLNRDWYRFCFSFQYPHTYTRIFQVYMYCHQKPTSFDNKFCRTTFCRIWCIYSTCILLLIHKFIKKKKGKQERYYMYPQIRGFI